MIQCSCIKGVYDCRVTPVSADKIIYDDLSNWMEDGYYVLPDDYKITVTTPGGSEYELSALPKASTILTNEDLGSQWFDGIYCFKAESCGEIYTKNVALLFKVQCCVDKLLVVADDFDRYMRWSSMIQSIKHLTEYGRIATAHSMYRVLKSELSQFENCC